MHANRETGESGSSEPTRDVLIVEDLRATRPLVQEETAPNLIGLLEASSLLAEPRGILVLFETVRILERDRVLLIMSPDSGVRRNGLAPPLLVPLEIGDQLTSGASALLHLSRRQQAEPIRPPPSLVGARCETCQVAFAATTLVVICGSCGSARHMEGDETPEGDRLQCADLGPCANCNTERPRESGLAYYPES